MDKPCNSDEVSPLCDTALPRESIARAKEEIQGNICFFQHVIVNRIQKSHFSLKRKRFEIDKCNKLLILYFMYGDEEYNPLIYLDSISL